MTEQHGAPESAWRPIVDQVLAELKDLPGAMLPILHGIQDRVGYVPPEAVPVIADVMNLTRAEVHGVITFYHHFRQHPIGKHVVRVCRAEACQAVGADGLVDHACAKLGVGFHETTSDGAFTLEAVYCLGNCALSPAILIDNELFGGVTSERFDEIIADVRNTGTVLA